MSVDRCILGIDPGISGAIAFYFPGVPSRVRAEDVPVAGGEISAAGLTDRIRKMRPDVAIIERVSAMPGQGVASVGRVADRLRRGRYERTPVRAALGHP